MPRKSNAIKSLREAIFMGVRKKTEEFNETIFPTPGKDWTSEQMDVFRFLTGENGSFQALNESDKPEIMKALLKLANITIKFPNQEEIVSVPPYAAIVLRSNIEPYRGSFPLIKSRLLGYWQETGGGSTRQPTLRISQLRKITEDELRTLETKFPDNLLPQLQGAIPIEESKLRGIIIESILQHTEELKGKLVEKYPEGITDKGKEILRLDVPIETRKALAIIIDDMKVLEPYQPAPTLIEYPPFCAVFHTADTAESVYKTDRVHIQAGLTTHDVFFTYPDEETNAVGNHADVNVGHFRPATEDEITCHIQELPSEKLHLYAPGIPAEKILSSL